LGFLVFPFIHGGAKRRQNFSAFLVLFTRRREAPPDFFRKIGTMYRYFMKNPSRSINMIFQISDLHHFACGFQLISPLTDLSDLIQFSGN